MFDNNLDNSLHWFDDISDNLLGETNEVSTSLVSCDPLSALLDAAEQVVLETVLTLQLRCCL